MDIVLVLACLYFAYVNVKSLLEVPFADWQFVQWMLVLVTVLLVVVAVLKAIQTYKKRQAEQAKAAAEALEIQRAEAEAEAAEEYDEEWTTLRDDDSESGEDTPAGGDKDTLHDGIEPEGEGQDD